MAKNKIYIGYIAWFIKHNPGFFTPSEMKIFLQKNIGSSLDDTTTSKLKKTAFIIYKSHLAGIVTCANVWDYVYKGTLKETELTDLINDQLKIRKKYGIYEPPIDMDMTSSSIEQNMESKKAGTSVIEGIYEYGIKKSRVAPKKTPVKKAPTKRRAPSTKKAKAKTPVKRKGKRCDDYKVVDLKKMATEKGIVGRSKMKKAELCKALGLK